MARVTSSILSAAPQYATNSTKLANLAALLISTRVLREMEISLKNGKGNYGISEFLCFG
jgi:hypothetical protein